jgi:hypothetical protein
MNTTSISRRKFAQLLGPARPAPSLSPRFQFGS